MEYCMFWLWNMSDNVLASFFGAHVVPVAFNTSCTCGAQTVHRWCTGRAQPMHRACTTGAQAGSSTRSDCSCTSNHSIVFFDPENGSQGSCCSKTSSKSRIGQVVAEIWYDTSMRQLLKVRAKTPFYCIFIGSLVAPPTVSLLSKICLYEERCFVKPIRHFLSANPLYAPTVQSGAHPHPLDLMIQ